MKPTVLILFFGAILVAAFLCYPMLESRMQQWINPAADAAVHPERTSPADTAIDGDGKPVPSIEEKRAFKGVGESFVSQGICGYEDTSYAYQLKYTLNEVLFFDSLADTKIEASEYTDLLEYYSSQNETYKLALLAFTVEARHDTSIPVYEEEPFPFMLELTNAYDHTYGTTQEVSPPTEVVYFSAHPVLPGEPEKEEKHYWKFSLEPHEKMDFEIAVIMSDVVYEEKSAYILNPITMEGFKLFEDMPIS